MRGRKGTILATVVSGNTKNAENMYLNMQHLRYWCGSTSPPQWPKGKLGYCS